MIPILIVFDQISKLVAGNSGIEIVRNRGIAFSILSDINPIFIAIILLILMVKCHCDPERSRGRSNPERDRHGLRDAPAGASLRPRDDIVWFGLIIAGGASNLIDRIRLGYVVDFIDLKFWQVFNLADVFITVGFLGILYGYLRRR